MMVSDVSVRLTGRSCLIQKKQRHARILTHLKLQKLQKGYYPPAHRLNVNVLLSNHHHHHRFISHEAAFCNFFAV